MSSSSHLPYAAEADAELSVPELEVLEEAYKRAALTSPTKIPLQIRFNYAWGLVRSHYRDDQRRGVELFREIFHEDRERQRECAYYLALGYYRLGNYKTAKRYNDLLLQAEPENLQALSLKTLIHDKAQREGLIGMALVGGAVAAVGALAVTLLKRK